MPIWASFELPVVQTLRLLNRKVIDACNLNFIRPCSSNSQFSLLNERN